MRELDPQDAKRIAQLAHDFLETPFGQLYIAQLSAYYNDLHQAAEDPNISMERKAFLAERAAGAKWAITYLTDRDAILQSGYFDKDDKLTPEDVVSQS